MSNLIIDTDADHYREVKRQGAFYNDFEDDTNNFNYVIEPAEQGSIYGKYNTWIIFGRDRPSGTGTELVLEKNGINAENTNIISKTVGYGPKGIKKSGMIDIVVGRLGRYKSNDTMFLENDKKTKKAVDPNFTLDACRIYVSQRTDIDDNFNLNGGHIGKSINESGIGIKADAVRIMARSTLKLFTGVDNGDLSVGSDVVSSPRKSIQQSGIELIANNRTDGINNDMQPIPKGQNLTNALDEILNTILNLSAILTDFAKIQSDFNDEIAMHTHIEKFQGHTTSQSFKLIPEGKRQSFNMFAKVFAQKKFLVANIATLRTLYFTPTSKKFINSKYHKLN